MVLKKCPGQDLSRKKIDEVVSSIECPDCGEEIEFFFDDGVRVCPGCGARVKKSDKRLLKDFGCAAWCNAAEDCLGPQLYSRFHSVKEKLIQEKNAQFQKLMESIPEEEKEIREFFIKAFHENTDMELVINPQKSIKSLRTENPGLYEKVIRYYSQYTQSLEKKSRKKITSKG